MRKNANDGKQNCCFCGVTVAGSGKNVTRHHIYGRKNSNKWEYAHKKCHNNFNRYYKLLNNNRVKILNFIRGVFFRK